MGRSIFYPQSGSYAAMSNPIPADFWTQPVVALARALIGTTLLVDDVGGVIVETEAYDIDDPAAAQRELDDISYALDHFRTKLLGLGDNFHTAAGRRMAAQRSAPTSASTRRPGSTTATRPSAS